MRRKRYYLTLKGVNHLRERESRWAPEKGSITPPYQAMYLIDTDSRSGVPVIEFFEKGIPGSVISTLEVGGYITSRKCRGVE